jgi:phosphatidylinositol glycan class B
MESKPAAEGLRERRKTGSGRDAETNAPDANDIKGAEQRTGRFKVHPVVEAAQVKDVLQLLLVFRFINAICVRTFFQPDEYFQALEPAWSIAFGGDSGAWLTWVGLRAPPSSYL